MRGRHDTGALPQFAPAMQNVAQTSGQGHGRRFDDEESRNLEDRRGNRIPGGGQRVKWFRAGFDTVDISACDSLKNGT
ncbi:hypothetical protein Q9Q94_10050 [Uliginosibacterium sp. 31-16]|uniref:hypothetical protein n=1 Tax=Uliginosibacterium sp. 31-16 TaxID=3068315 RepID=UPI00273D833E|nr:hypothetical protein [Uliginosibacterium sp. 31-16]MDP5239876.1 hypothetical protein [Uliginosibacterium sp. 31-16]